MGLFENMFGHQVVKRKIKQDEEKRLNLKSVFEREKKAESISKKYGVTLDDARNYFEQESRMERGKETVAKIKSTLKGIKAWKEKHIIPFEQKKHQPVLTGSFFAQPEPKKSKNKRYIRERK